MMNYLLLLTIKSGQRFEISNQSQRKEQRRSLPSELWSFWTCFKLQNEPFRISCYDRTYNYPHMNARFINTVY